RVLLRHRNRRHQRRVEAETGRSVAAFPVAAPALLLATPAFVGVGLQLALLFTCARVTGIARFVAGLDALGKRLLARLRVGGATCRALARRRLIAVAAGRGVGLHLIGGDLVKVRALTHGPAALRDLLVERPAGQARSRAALLRLFRLVTRVIVL